MFNHKITVFTPTYNRGYTIEQLYQSLKRQTNTDFEWLVVDDGSNDNTEELFSKWTKENNNFQIKYYKQENGGKHRAINFGIDKAQGELFFIVDSDDYLTDDAIEKIIDWESTIKNSPDKFVGIAGNRGYSNNQIIGKTFKGNYIDATSLERKEYNILGDKAEAFYTHILQDFKFPEFEGEKFITEGVVWNKLARKGYKIRWFNEIIYIGNYLEDGLTRNLYKNILNNWQGYLYYNNDLLASELNILDRLRYFSNFFKMCYIKKDFKSIKLIHNKKYRYISCILGYVLYLRDRKFH